MTTHTSKSSRNAHKRYGSLPRLSFTHEQVRKAIQTLSNLRDYSNGHNDSAIKGFIDFNPDYYHGLNDALNYAALAIADLQAEVAKRDAEARAFHEKTYDL